MRKILLALALAAPLLAGSAGMASASPAAAPKAAPLPVLYNLGGGTGAVWDYPQVKPKIFYIFADGTAAVTGMHWARWNHGERMRQPNPLPTQSANSTTSATDSSTR